MLSVYVFVSLLTSGPTPGDPLLTSGPTPGEPLLTSGPTPGDPLFSLAAGLSLTYKGNAKRPHLASVSILRPHS